MNVWFAAAIALLVLVGACGIGTLRGTASERLVALELGTTIGVLVLLLIEQGFERQSFFDVSLAFAVLAVPSTFVFARFYRRWL